MSRLSFLKFQGSFSGKPSSPRQNQSKKNSFNSRQTSTAGLNFYPNKDEMKWVFTKFDTNKDGKISLQEYKAAVRALDRGVGDTEAAQTFKVMDSDGDGFIDFIEFMEMFNGDQGSRIKEEEIKSAFQVFDFNGDGKISAEELLRVLKSLGESCSLSACKKMVKGVDGNGDGFRPSLFKKLSRVSNLTFDALIDLNEFMRMMMSGKKLA